MGLPPQSPPRVILLRAQAVVGNPFKSLIDLFVAQNMTADQPTAESLLVVFYANSTNPVSLLNQQVFLPGSHPCCVWGNVWENFEPVSLLIFSTSCFSLVQLPLLFNNSLPVPLQGGYTFIDPSAPTNSISGVLCINGPANGMLVSNASQCSIAGPPMPSPQPVSVPMLPPPTANARPAMFVKAILNLPSTFVNPLILSPILSQVRWNIFNKFKFLVFA